MRRLLFAAFVLGLGVGCSSETSTPTTPTPTTKTYSVEYRVTSSTTVYTPTVSLTYENQAGSTSQTSRTVLPWSYTLGGGTGRFVYVSAQNDGGTTVAGVHLSAGLTTVQILLNGQVWKTAYASGDFSIGTVSGSLP